MKYGVDEIIVSIVCFVYAQFLFTLNRVILVKFSGIDCSLEFSGITGQLSNSYL